MTRLNASKWLWCLCAVLTGGVARAGPSGPSVPATHIPPPVVAELMAVEHQFDLALAQDCAPERCFSKGCVYLEHAVVDQPRSASLPGLGTSEGPGAGTPQEYLTRARCEFAHEKSVQPKDVLALIKRLEAKLSKGWLVVSVERQILEPVPPSLRESPVPPVPPPTPTGPTGPVTPPPTPKWELAVALRELWVSLLPHFSWMIAVFLATLAAMTVIWSLRRLGRESLEEKALLARLGAETALPAGDGDEKAEAKVEVAELPPDDKKLLPGNTGEDQVFVDGQRNLWNDRIENAQLSKGQSVVLDLLREWLRVGEFALLAKAVFVFADRLSLSFPTEGDLAQRKLDFADYLRKVDESKLPSDADFFRKLNQYALSSAVLVQPDADAYRSLREEFGAGGIARLVEELPQREGALLFAVAPAESQGEIARGLSPKKRLEVANHLLVSNRIAKDEIAFLIDVVRAARIGEPPPESRLAGGLVDRGREFDAADALSTLLPQIEPESRSILFAAAQKAHHGVFPRWYEGILFADMLLKLPAEVASEVVLELDIRELAGWLSVQPVAWQKGFVKGLPPSLQSALGAASAFGSRDDQMVLAKRGRRALAAAIQRLCARGKLAFADLVL